MGGCLLEREGLPPFHSLENWVAVLCWVRMWELGRVSLAHSAYVVGREPSACYRVIERTTGQRWSTVRALGSYWVLTELVISCKRPRLRVEGKAPALQIPNQAAVRR